GADMDHPRDIRYRYNRGCAAYQQGNYQGAQAAFSSVLRRTQDPRMRFSAAYNLGNTAFKQGDFASAAEYFRQAIILNPENEDVKYNLELSLRELERRKKEKNQDQNQQAGQDGRQGEKKKDQKDQGKDGKDQDADKKPGEKKQGRESSADNDKKGETPQDRDKETGDKKTERPDEAGQREKESPKDLQGELKPLQDFKEEEGAGQKEGDALSSIDRKKAEALLDNMKEDRSRFLRLQVPPEKRGGVSSGKDW
ncbi:MAG: tetratricopeptide repeat protein, partial [Pseudomonadota bacterium]